MFTVPIIPPDLRHEETIIQAAYALDCLQKTINTIFGHIDKRIEKNNNKVKELQERLEKSQRKINSFQGTRKAIHIYAPARFPASNVFKDIPVTFDKEDRAKITKSIAYDKAKYQVQHKVDPNLPNINEKLIFFHVREQNNQKFASDNSLAKERLNIKQNQDLGNMPSDLRSIPSVLLFNTDYSVYDLDECDSEAGRSDAWKRCKLFKNKRQQYGNQQQSAAKQILEPAPHSLAHRNEKRTPSGGLKYTPKLCEAPELDLPLDLPDLPGIADDLRYESQEAKQKIAPSLAMVVENLPELTELMKENEITANSPRASGNKEEINSAITIAPSPPPPPPPPPASLNVTHQAPPPPPPPPSKNQPTKTNINNTPYSSTDTRSELMAAIRNAGGSSKAHLRHTAAAPLTKSHKDDVDSNSSKIQNSPTQKPIAKVQGGDLMADLHNKLLMRRKGISGSKDNAGNTIRNNTNSKNDIPSGNPVISRLSSLIPPPPTKDKNRNKANTTSDEDDSNDTDWVD